MWDGAGDIRGGVELPLLHLPSSFELRRCRCEDSRGGWLEPYDGKGPIIRSINQSSNQSTSPQSIPSVSAVQGSAEDCYTPARPLRAASGWPWAAASGWHGLRPQAGMGCGSCDRILKCSRRRRIALWSPWRVIRGWEPAARTAAVHPTGRGGPANTLSQAGEAATVVHSLMSSGIMPRHPVSKGM